LRHRKWTAIIFISLFTWSAAESENLGTQEELVVGRPDGKVAGPKQPAEQVSVLVLELVYRPELEVDRPELEVDRPEREVDRPELEVDRPEQPVGG
jgi:hypothetical protein